MLQRNFKLSEVVGAQCGRCESPSKVRVGTRGRPLVRGTVKCGTNFFPNAALPRPYEAFGARPRFPSAGHSARGTDVYRYAGPASEATATPPTRVAPRRSHRGTA